MIKNLKSIILIKIQLNLRNYIVESRKKSMLSKKNRCLKCDKFNCNIKKCENKKFEIYSKRITFNLMIFNQIDTKKFNIK